MPATPVNAVQKNWTLTKSWSSYNAWLPNIVFTSIRFRQFAILYLLSLIEFRQ